MSMSHDASGFVGPRFKTCIFGDAKAVGQGSTTATHDEPKFWERGDTHADDLHCFKLNMRNFFVQLTDDFGLADGFHVVFCELPIPEPYGTLCILSVMRSDEPLAAATVGILRGRDNRTGTAERN